VAAFTVGTSYAGGQSVLGGGDSGMNTTFNIFNRGEVFPFVSSLDTSGFAYFRQGEVYPAIYYIAAASSSAAANSMTATGIAIAIGIGL